MLTDPIADALTRLRNANTAGHEKVDIPSSRLKVEIMRVLRDEGFIKGYKVVEDGRQGILRVHLKYGPGNERVLRGIVRASKPGLRVYAGIRRMPRVLTGLGMAVLSTSKGVMTDRKARKQAVGGEVLFFVW
ncbi:MAG: 30S ribosomal protein S8 [candidate division NC10 bacterium]|uniref:Small ribosomal subunit protein uS8 n=2 Tax=environmental samples TaxID=48479 RepID=A0A0H4TWB8_9BACT|nr:30S ribosomal protein S8, small subunit ribosomal protein S8 [uncultured bacterium Rifle_16ft_4_minimus_752]AKQ05239.1 30S ribosomal protein S8, small subunit ribosomal protein S8 [uncultured bacterium Rifle_16ft_4_minimus_28965]MDZ4339682.1 30S ribosomal protein S8 [candidate division NC10 bacterium]HZX61124.1 30S ribosomal protein S8 [Candidatus Methylomirabilis sp.]